MKTLRNLTRSELERWVTAELGWPRFRADQLFHGLHGQGATSVDGLTTLSKAARQQLADRTEWGMLEVEREQRSSEGTGKLVLRCGDGALIETVLIPDGDKLTQCISSQVGCAVDCQFCATAKLGFGRNLTTAEIVEQVYRAQALVAPEGRRITHLVFMGMGEPLHNYDHVMRALGLLTDAAGLGLSPRRITVSTAGLVPGIERLGQESLRVNLAVSLNATTDAQRDSVMPINRTWNIATLLGALRRYPLERRRRITLEYVLLEGVNDSREDARRLGALLRGIPCKVNLIPWNPHPQAPYRRPTDAAVAAFQQAVRAAGLPAYLRSTRGDEIDAACGQLAARPDAVPFASSDAPIERLVPLRRRGDPRADRGESNVRAPSNG
jgi:23S rRNA (adenine2503-C2)-methyltransferase